MSKACIRRTRRGKVIACFWPLLVAVAYAVRPALLAVSLLPLLVLQGDRVALYLLLSLCLLCVPYRVPVSLVSQALGFVFLSSSLLCCLGLGQAGAG
jgi:hypothetical protein